MSNLFALKLRKILNDLKRRPEDAAVELNISIEEINKMLNGELDPDFRLLKKATEIWPINLNDFFGIEDDTINNYKIFTNAESNNTTRIMQRKNKPYYRYKDTVMSKISPFRPEWIEELVVVDDNNPENPNVVFNNGHFLHQFTYFVGPVNFYYINDSSSVFCSTVNALANHSFANIMRKWSTLRLSVAFSSSVSSAFVFNSLIKLTLSYAADTDLAICSSVSSSTDIDIGLF